MNRWVLVQLVNLSKKLIGCAVEVILVFCEFHSIAMSTLSFQIDVLVIKYKHIDNTTPSKEAQEARHTLDVATSVPVRITARCGIIFAVSLR